MASFSICLLIISAFSMQFSLVVDAVSDTDSLSVGQVITRSETLVSSGKFFELGFFRPGQSRNYYVGIWYKNIPERTVVWVANRDQPLTSSSPVLTISSEGNLVIEDGRITYRVSENVSSSQNTTATLLDSGNFVLRNEKLGLLWQSFDYPSHTFLPGMKLGYSRKTGKVWSLTSWKSRDDPSVGDAELKMEPGKSNAFSLMKRSQIVWTSGVWDDYIFSLVPEMTLNYIFNYSLYTDENETYFIYSIKDSTISRCILDVSGQVEQMSWLGASQAWFLFWAQPRTSCVACRPFSICNTATGSCQCLQGFIRSDKNLSDECVRRTALQCGDNSADREDRFLRMHDVKLPSQDKVLKLPGIEECKSACLNNCACTAYAYNSSGVCSSWDGKLYDLKQLSKNEGETIFIKLDASELPKPGGNKELLWITVIVVPLLLTASYIFLRWRRKLKYREEREPSQDMLLFDINSSTETSKNELSDGRAGKSKSTDAWLPLFSFASVSASTNNFSAENKLGEGGFGPVYKGELLNGQEVAVKRLSKKSGQGLEELKNETMLIAKLQHRNLVRLLGCCLDQDEKILIYEYLPNKSLDSFIFDRAKKRLLYWETRVKIIEGIAQGLLYLHQYSRLRIIHRDLKASNILLDTDMKPQNLWIFGMEECLWFNVNLSRRPGQPILQSRSDVFSFGAWDLWKDNRALDLMDPILENEASYPMLARYVNVALLCVHENATDRPTMSEVVSMLTNEHLVLLRRNNQLSRIFIRDGEKLVSSSQRFELGFFSPGKSKYRYLGIWYKQIPDTIVWVANRNSPIFDSNAVLTISNGGKLVLLNQTNGTIWSSNLSREVKNPVAQLLDTGNLVVRDNFSSNSSEDYLWQSFDHPSDTLLAGMKLGWDLKTGLERYQTSWKSDDDPSPGNYTHRLDIHVLPKLCTYNGSVKLLCSGPWNGAIFAAIPSYSYLYKPTVVDNEDEIYYRYDSYNSPVIMTLKLNPSGKIQHLIWNERNRTWEAFFSLPDRFCQFYGHCGANSICSFDKKPHCECLKGFELKSHHNKTRPGTCVRSQSSDCKSGDRFIMLDDVKLPDLVEASLNESMNVKECEAECLKNCTCRAYANSKVTGEGSGCLMWFGDLIDIRKADDRNNGQSIYIRVPASELAANSRTRDSWFPMFSLASVSAATANFSTDNKLGEGGFGPVYKGRLLNGQEVAVKRLSSQSGQGQEEFKNEIKLIAKLQHRNLVRLLGCCIELEEKILIYEYMPNKSLDFFLFDSTKENLLGWGTRVRIIEGIAQGLLYLHQYSRLRVIHRDLKASNILLDKDMNPKISDFGMARIFGGDELQSKTKRIVGTYFGVLLLETLSSKRNTDFSNTNSLTLLGHAWDLWKDDRAWELIDPTLQNEASYLILNRYINVGLLCVQEDAADRPTMFEVVSMLTNKTINLPHPRQPAFSSIRGLKNTILPANGKARLLDTGNLVVRDNLISNSSEDYLWQSFDHPSDTLLAGMKLGWDLKTGLERYQTSWKSDDDPSPGNYTHRLDVHVLPKLCTYNGSVKLLCSGPWNGAIFASIPSYNYLYKRTVVDDEDEIYYRYDSYNSPIIMMLKLNPSGKIQHLMWNERNKEWVEFFSGPDHFCQFYGHCGANSICSFDKKPHCECLKGFELKSEHNKATPGTCVRSQSSDCKSGDRFIMLDDIKLPELVEVSLIESMNVRECEAECLKNCTCKAFANTEVKGGGSGCLMWFGDLVDTRKSDDRNNGQSIYIRVPASELETKKSQDLLQFDINMSTATKAYEFCKGNKAANSRTRDSWFPMFSLASVSAATSNFSTENKLGEGGFGPVYRGRLLNGQEVAVKRLSRQSRQGLEEFKNEIKLIAKLQHRNLVRLLGYCIELEEKILIYEYMPNKSLDFFLFDSTEDSLLRWGTRVRIIEGIAQGLLYLHQYSRLRVIHRDLKASNILLDKDMNPKISDFGMARMFGGDELQSKTKRIVGTYGYMSPEYAQQGLFSIKSDVFSFGVLLLETLSSKRNIDFSNSDSLTLIGHAWDLWKDDRAWELIDPTLQNEASYLTLNRYINVALLCVQEDAVDRPTMFGVVSMLINETINSPHPRQPAFSNIRGLKNTILPASRKDRVCSGNCLTLSVMDAR
ncbi:hypothetical protein CUMW_163410 [Citrus unshiu]|nr:hypothetical protein CUMW_163410 [Citrus unshiu]